MPKFSVDFTNAGDGFARPPEGEYICKVKSAELTDGAKAKNIKWMLIIGTGALKGKELMHNTTLSPAGLFNLRNFLIACGQDVPKSAFQVNTDACIGKIIGVVLAHTTYKDKETGEDKQGTKFTDIYPAVKGPNGWGRGANAVKAVSEVPQGAPAEDDEEDLSIPPTPVKATVKAAAPIAQEDELEELDI